MPRVSYVVEEDGDHWSVRLDARRFGPYSSLDTATAAAVSAARKAEAQGFDAEVVIRSAPMPTEGLDAA